MKITVNPPADDIEAAYAIAFDEWHAGQHHELWDQAVADGLFEARNPPSGGRYPDSRPTGA